MKELIEVLESASPGTRRLPPGVKELRKVVAERARRRRRRLLASTATGLALFTALGALATTGSLQAPSIIEAGPASRLQSELGSGETSLPATTDGPQVDIDGEWWMALPAEGWQLVSLHSKPESARRLGAGALVIGHPGEAPLGPVATASYEADTTVADELVDLEASSELRQVATAAGQLVHLGPSDEPGHLVALAEIDGGVVMIQSLEIGEDELLALVDGLALEDGSLTIRPAVLPPGLAQLDAGDRQAFLTTTATLERPNGDQLVIEVRPDGEWESVLAGRRIEPGADVIDRADRRGVIHEVPANGSTSAAVVLRDRLYTIEIVLGRSGVELIDQELIDQELIEVIDSLIPVSGSKLAAELELEPRSEVVNRWLTETPLPADEDLEWLAVGPPLDPQVEVEEVHLWFGCTWVHHWQRTGEEQALDEINNSNRWPTGRLFLDSLGGSGVSIDALNDLVGFERSQLERARVAADESERSQNPLVSTCAARTGR